MADNPTNPSTTPFSVPSPAAVAAWGATHPPASQPKPQGTPRRDGSYAGPHQQRRTDQVDEQVQPRAMWGLAQAASKAGWKVTIGPRPQYRDGDGFGWMLIIQNARHCIHVEYIRSTDERFPDRVWRLVNRDLTTRCPHGDRVKINDLREWLGTHPRECTDRGEETFTLADLPYMRRSCRDRHPHPRRWDGPVHGGEIYGGEVLGETSEQVA
jgi:hypothetical protein